MDFPKYSSLPRPDASGLPLAWGVWGDDDQLGTLNNITPEITASAARLVRAGLRFNLNLPLHMPLGMIGEGAHRWRRGPSQTLLKAEYAGLPVRDDKIDEFYLQSSTQWDGLSHIGCPICGFYNGARDADITQAEGTRNGIEHFAAFGIATRGVLVDLPRFFARAGRNWAPMGSLAASAADIQRCLDEQGTPLRAGDLLLVRTGWVEAFRAAAGPEARDRLFRGRDYSGLSGQADICGNSSGTIGWPAWPPTASRPKSGL